MTARGNCVMARGNWVTTGDNCVMSEGNSVLDTQDWPANIHTGQWPF